MHYGIERDTLELRHGKLLTYEIYCLLRMFSIKIPEWRPQGRVEGILGWEGRDVYWVGRVERYIGIGRAEMCIGLGG